MDRRDPPPWMKLLPDPDPPTPAMLGGALRERAPSIHEEVASIGERHPEAQKDRVFWGTVWRLFHAIVEGLPEEIVTDLAPAPVEALTPSVERKAVHLLTQSKRLQPRARARTSFPWPHQDVYEESDALLPRSRPDAPEQIRQAAAAAYQLFVRVAVALFRLFERSVIDPATARHLRQQFAK